jgi:hypothetical protein
MRQDSGAEFNLAEDFAVKLKLMVSSSIWPKTIAVKLMIVNMAKELQSSK